MMLEDGERVRARIHDALGVEQPDPSLRSRVMASMPVEREEVRPHWQWAMGGVAAALAIALVAGLVATRGGGGGPSPSSRVVGSLDVTTRLDFTCTLPVRGPQSLATIGLPDGTLRAEAAPQSTRADTLRRGHWLPVPSAWVSPDGRSYAYTTNSSGAPGQTSTSSVAVHDVSSGRDRTVWSGPGAAQVLSWEPAGIVFTRQPQPLDGAELWTVDPAGGAARRVGPSPPDAQPPYQPVVGGGAAWIATGDGRTLRFDLRDASLATWFVAPAGSALTILGMDAQGHPVLSVGRPGAVLQLTGPGQTVAISNGADASFMPASAAGDAHGIWFTGPGTLWLYRAGALVRVATVPAGLLPAGEASSPSDATLLLLGGCS